MNSIPEILLTGGGFTALVSIGNWIFNRKKDHAEVGDLTTTTSAKLVQMSSEYAEKVDARLTKVNETVDRMNEIVEKQSEQIETHRSKIEELWGVIEKQRDEHSRQIAEKDEHIAKIEKTAACLQEQVDKLRRFLVRRGMDPDDAYDETLEDAQRTGAASDALTHPG